MPQQKKFIITQDQSVSNLLIAHGFHLISNVCGTYTFMNEPNKLNFEQFDKKLVYFTNKINI